MLFCQGKEMNMINKFWTPEEFDRAHQMAKDGYSAREIGLTLKRTRNSVIGVLHRAGFEWARKKKPVTLATKGPPNPRRERPRTERGTFKTVKEKREKMPPKFFPIDFSVPANGGVRLMDLQRHHCRAVIGETKGADTIYCGEVHFNETSWCKEHYMRYHTRQAA